MLLNNLLLRETSSKFWIENRSINVVDIEDLLLEYEGYEETVETVETVSEETKKEVLEELTIRPAQPATELVAEIRVQGDLVSTSFPERNEEFRVLARELKFTWQNSRWERKTGIISGSSLDRATELGVKLLAKGFPVRVYDDALQKKIITGDYEPECTRWVMQNVDSGMFIIKWDRSRDDFYAESKKLPGAKWKSGSGMLVPKESFREVLDFADRYKFQLSPGAQELLEEARAEFETAMVANVKVPQRTNAAPGRPKLSADQVDGEIDESLHDEVLIRHQREAVAKLRRPVLGAFHGYGYR